VTREERIKHNEEYLEIQKNKKADKEKLLSNYNQLSYRNRLLLRMVIDFMLNNPDCECGG